MHKARQSRINSVMSLSTESCGHELISVTLHMLETSSPWICLQQYLKDLINVSKQLNFQWEVHFL